MPCSSEYIEPSIREEETLKAAKQLLSLIELYNEVIGKNEVVNAILDINNRERPKIDSVTRIKKIEKMEFPYPYPTKDDSDFVIKSFCDFVKYLREHGQYQTLINDFGNEKQLRIALWVVNHDKADKERGEQIKPPLTNLETRIVQLAEESISKEFELEWRFFNKKDAPTGLLLVQDTTGTKYGVLEVSISRNRNTLKGSKILSWNTPKLRLDSFDNILLYSVLLSKKELREFISQGL
jgi:hypothetical protein